MVLKVCTSVCALALLTSLAWGAPRPRLAPDPGPAVTEVQVPTPTPAPIPPVVQAPAPPVVVPTAAPNTQITTTAPVTSDTTISIGTLAGQVLTWILAVFSVPIGGFVVQIVAKYAAKIGVDLDDTRRERLQEIVVNGLHAAAANIPKSIDGKLPFDVKSKLMADTIRYTQAHGADTLKKLGLKPDSANAQEAITARAEVALADPAVPISMAPAEPAETVDDKIKKALAAQHPDQPVAAPQI